MSKIAVIGAGKTGRGFIGRLLQEDQHEIIFIDQDQALVDAMNDRQYYSVCFFADNRPAIDVRNYRAYTWENADFHDVEWIFTAAGGSNLAAAGAELNRRLDKDCAYFLITCENSPQPAKVLQAALSGHNVLVSEATVFCTTLSDGLDIISEDYPWLQVNADLLMGHDPQIKGVKLLQGFPDFLTRKLYTYNTASCVIAYLGWLHGYQCYADAANDPEILTLLDHYYVVINPVMCAEYGYEPADQTEFSLLSREKFLNRSISDTVTRNARDPKRKLAAQERIIGPLRLIRKHGKDVSVLITTAAAMLLYDAPDELEWRQLRQMKGPAWILKHISNLDENDQLYQDILDKASILQKIYGKNGVGQ